MFKAVISIMLGGLFICALAGAASAQTDKAKKIDAFIRPFVEANQFSGVIVATENGRVIYEKPFGYANVEHKIPNAVNTRIGIASITKLMTAVIRTRLVEEKKISLDDTVAKYIPDFPNGDKITIDMLATHRAGVPHRVMPPEQEAVPHSSADMVEWIKKAKPLFEPGTKRTYSSGGYTLLTRVMEVASGKTYAQLLQEYVFSPAGMRDSLDFEGEMIMERRAQDYLLDDRGPINAALKDYSFLVGAGSVFGTAPDLIRFGEAVVDGKYGAGVATRLIGDAGTLSGSGSTNGHRAYLEVEKSKKYGYAVLANLSSGAFDIVQAGVRDIMLGKEVAPAVIRPKIIPNPNKDINEFLGRYRSADGSDIEITLRNGYLYSSDIKLFPIAPDCFFDYKFFGTACFVRDNGRIKEIQWKGSNFSLTWVRQ